MKNVVIILFVAALYSCEQKKTEKVETADQTEIVADKNREIDSLKNVISEQNSEKNDDGEHAIPDPNDPVYGNQEDGTETPETSTAKDLSGKHSLTLHWVSWDKPGIITFKKTGDKTYKVSGKQSIKDQYVTIEGKITQISPLELQFEGTVITNNNLDGKCVKTGPQLFLSTKGRKYWRMQNMENCNGAVDYIDIYF